MIRDLCWWPLVALSLVVAAPATYGQVEGAVVVEDGFESIFDGKSLGVWDGNPKFWRVEDGCLTGETTEDNPTKGNTFCIWRGGITGGFELKLEYKIGKTGNSGIQYRSFEVPGSRWVVGGYQADIDSGDRYSGINYGERFRGILADRGQKTIVRRVDGKVVVDAVGSVGESAEIQTHIKKEDWNSYHIIVRGNVMEHRINGVTTSICTDEDEQERRFAGVLALQLHAGPPMKIQFRNIQLKRLEPFAKHGAKKIVFLPGNPSHGFGAHDHQSGCMLLAWLLNQSGLPVQTEVHLHGWPEDAGTLADADAIVSYTDGGAGHPFNKHLEEVDELAQKGVGLVFIHYGVEVPKGPSGEKFLEWMGGYFEPHWSVNPHWTAKYDRLPDHPTTRGVRPFSTYDEWYYHMRFNDEIGGVMPILTDVPTEETLTRPDGPHSGNPDVRQAVKNHEPQHMAWARERPDGGRGFGCTGGHVHWNWGNEEFRKLILNAIVWAAKLEVPADGVPPGTVTVEDLLTNHDEPIPDDFNKARIEALLEEWKSRPADPQEKLDSAVREAIRLLEGKQYARLLTDFVSPEDLEKITRDETLEELAQDFGKQRSASLLKALKSIQETRPTYDADGMRATFPLKDPVGTKKAITFRKVASRWYIEN